MSRPPCERGTREAADAGFTLFEILVVMVMMVMAIAAVSTLYRAPSAGTTLKTVAHQAASRLRDLRAAAMATQSERTAAIDVDGRSIAFGDGRAPLQLDRSLVMSVTAADSERTSARNAGIRFFPNGSSSGATIQLKSERLIYEVRVNWLTGRVSTAAID
jgi:general secretion pathway protein H